MKTLLSVLAVTAGFALPSAADASGSFAAICSSNACGHVAQQVVIQEQVHFVPVQRFQRVHVQQVQRVQQVNVIQQWVRVKNVRVRSRSRCGF